MAALSLLLLPWILDCSLGDSHFMTNWDEDTMLLEGTQHQRFAALPFHRVCECQCDDLTTFDPVMNTYALRMDNEVIYVH